MPLDVVPPEIRDLADTRAVARRARDWATADRIKGELAAAGWRVIDAASLYSLERAIPSDVERGGATWYGGAASVPSRLEEPETGTATVVLIAAGAAAEIAATIDAVRAGSPTVPVVVVVDGPIAPEAEASLAGPGEGVEVIRLATHRGHAAALNAGIRRAASPVVVVLGAGVRPDGDLAGALVAALQDPTVAVAGPFGLVSDDLREFEPAPAGFTDVVAIDGAAMAFRRTEFIARGPLDEHFTIPASLDTWWSLVLRDQGEDDPEDAAPRRAVVAGSTLAIRSLAEGAAEGPGAERLAKKSFYRVLKRFATRRDLLIGGEG